MTTSLDHLCAQLADALSAVGVRPEHVRAAAAKLVLQAVAEPGDGTLGGLAQRAGAERIAELLLSKSPAADLVAADAASGGAVDPAALQAGLARWLPRVDTAALRRSTDQAARLGAQLVIAEGASWPIGLSDLGAHAPHALWVRGRRRALVGPGVAMVGARAATGYGETVASESAVWLAERGITVVSGGAYGIDGAAHRSVLQAGGTTVAFLAGGIDRFYPAGHDQLLTRVAETGAVISELPCGASPTRWRFLLRNRLIAAASLATVVIEAGLRSGALNTAGHAADLGRPLGAVPGPVTSPSSAGCHRLLREYDAICVTSGSDMAELAGLTGEATLPTAFTDPSEGRVVQALSARVARTLDEIVVRTGMSAADAMRVLGSLDLNGRVRRTGGGWLVIPARSADAP
ncbi:MAG TPA: DNA-processing protein DprA [Candidatus Lumbricidophila sp.]|nr:DNA-processing protein DprA [Candidatus Lumbricidophila sp.]